MKNLVNKNKKCILLATNLAVIKTEKSILSQLNCDFAVFNQLQYEVFLQDYLTMTLLTNIQHDTK